jgi:hypothetical protein
MRTHSTRGGRAAAATAPNDVVIVAAKTAYDFYLRSGDYHCQVGRSFQEGLQSWASMAERRSTL